MINRIEGSASSCWHNPSLTLTLSVSRFWSPSKATHLTSWRRMWELREWKILSHSEVKWCQKYVLMVQNWSHLPVEHSFVSFQMLCSAGIASLPDSLLTGWRHVTTVTTDKDELNWRIYYNKQSERLITLNLKHYWRHARAAVVCCLLCCWWSLLHCIVGTFRHMLLMSCWFHTHVSDTIKASHAVSVLLVLWCCGSVEFQMHKKQKTCSTVAPKKPTRLFIGCCIVNYTNII